MYSIPFYSIEVLQCTSTAPCVAALGLGYTHTETEQTLELKICDKKSYETEMGQSRNKIPSNHRIQTAGHPMSSWGHTQFSSSFKNIFIAV